MTTALYRRYRPDTFEDVIGQDHVTGPLMQALSKDRVNHAYLFSGPRGCGKTTSARILARCLNCAQGPTPTPCGECDSCLELATGGPGALDVIEIDAASHGGVDDARDLRERATFAPVRDRYKIFIIDEAHMVTSAGFNALLKIVEEPPEHIKFIFATTEPDKVIGTIRSRTHHYPFRLVPPEPLMEYLERLCTQEGVAVAPGVLSLVVRAGGGSVRDTLSVLDQLMAGATDGGLDYEMAVSLLGYTPDALLDDVVDAVAASDSQTVFRVVDRVVQSGQDPRRFVEDLLERFRDLVIVKAMPEAAASVLHGMPEDQLRRLETQSAQLGGGEISRAADIINHALTEMVGATSPRLHLELLMARLMLPSTDQTERGLAARLDRIERRLSYGESTPLPDDGTSSAASGSPQSAAGFASPAPSDQHDRPENTEGLTGAALARAAMRRDQPAAETPPSRPEPSQAPAPSPEAAAPTEAPVRPAVPAEPTVPPAAVSGEAEQEQEEQAEQHPAAAAPMPPSERPQEPTDRQAGVPEHDTPAPRQERPAPAAADWGGTWATPVEDTPAPAARPEASRPEPSRPDPSRQEQQRPAPQSRPEPSDRASQQSRPAPQRPEPAREPASQQRSAPQQPSGERPAPQGGPSGGNSVEMVRRAWPEVLDVLQENARFIWIVVSQNASVAGFDGQLLTIGFTNDGARDRVLQRGGDQDIARAVSAVLGLQPQIDLITGGSAPAGGPGPKADGRPQPAAPQPQQSAAPEPRPAAARPEPTPARIRPEPAAPNAWALPPEPEPQPERPEPEPYPYDDEPPAFEDDAPTDPYAPFPEADVYRPQDDGGLNADDVPVSDGHHPSAARTEDRAPDEEQDRDDDEDQGPDDDAPAATAPAAPESPAPDASPKVARPEPGWGIPVFARPEAEMRAGASSTPTPAAASTPSAADSSPHGRRASRFQQMMEQYQRTQSGGPAPRPGTSAPSVGQSASDPADGSASTDSPAQGSSSPTAGGSWRDAAGETNAPGEGPTSGPGVSAGSGYGTGGVNAPAGPGSVDWSEETPSDDDETIEDSGLAGRPVVERILGARLIEERSLDGGPLG